MGNQRSRAPRAKRLHLAAMSVAICANLSGCGGGGGDDQAPAAVTSLNVPKVANCATGDSPEPGLQGQVPAAVRSAGFKGYNCNLKLVGQVQGEGGNWSAATFADDSGRSCAYHATNAPSGNFFGNTFSVTRKNPGTQVIDISDPAKPLLTTSLTTSALLDPWESLRVNKRRKILIGDNGANFAGGGPELDIYDLSGDCRSPQLLASVSVPKKVGSTETLVGALGHEGNVSPDGLTYYRGDNINARYDAIDISDFTKPRIIASFDVGAARLGGAHGLSVSADGTRMYGVTPGTGGAVPGNTNIQNGFIVFDTSEVQSRVPNAQIKVMSHATFADGSGAQHTVPFKSGGKSYLVMVDEGGSAGIADGGNAYINNSCAKNMSPFPMARIYDLSDEMNPVPVSKLMLETHDCAYRDQVKPDVVGLSIFTYGSHYCSVDNRENATALACSYFNSGIRVFDIRDPARPKEVAYYNPASGSRQEGSSHVRLFNWVAGGPDWCASRSDFDFARKQLVTMCQDNGLLVMQFAAGTWPFPESKPSDDVGLQ